MAIYLFTLLCELIEKQSVQFKSDLWSNSSHQHNKSVGFASGDKLFYQGAESSPDVWLLSDSVHSQ